MSLGCSPPPPPSPLLLAHFFSLRLLASFFLFGPSWYLCLSPPISPGPPRFLTCPVLFNVGHLSFLWVNLMVLTSAPELGSFPTLIAPVVVPLGLILMDPGFAPEHFVCGNVCDFVGRWDHYMGGISGYPRVRP